MEAFCLVVLYAEGEYAFLSPSARSWGISSCTGAPDARTVALTGFLTRAFQPCLSPGKRMDGINNRSDPPAYQDWVLESSAEQLVRVEEDRQKNRLKAVKIVRKRKAETEPVRGLKFLKEARVSRTPFMSSWSRGLPLIAV